MVDLNFIVSRVDDVISRVLPPDDGTTRKDNEDNKETILILPKSAQVKVLNGVGTRIWSLIDGRRTVKEICEILLDEYDVGSADLERDTSQFLFELHDRGLINIVDQIE